MEKFEAVEALTTYQLAAEAAADKLKDGVWTARDLGASWSEIGLTLHISKQAAQQKYGNRPNTATRDERRTAAIAKAQTEDTADDFGTPAIEETTPYEFNASNSKITAKVLVQAVLNGLDVRKEELPPLYNGAYEQIAVTIQEPHGNGWLYLVQTVGSNGKSSHGAYIAFTTGGKARKISIQGLMQCLREWGNPNETTQAHATELTK